MDKTTGNNRQLARESRIGARASGGKKFVRYLIITTLMPQSRTTNSNNAKIILLVFILPKQTPPSLLVFCSILNPIVPLIAGNRKISPHVDPFGPAGGECVDKKSGSSGA